VGRDFDFLAAYVIPEDVWYIIPGKRIVSGKKTAIMLYTTSPTSRWAPYKENWDQLRNHGRRTKPRPGPDQAEEVLPDSDVVPWATERRARDFFTDGCILLIYLQACD
jgi:hypothetical protein